MLHCMYDAARYAYACVSVVQIHCMLCQIIMHGFYGSCLLNECVECWNVVYDSVCYCMVVRGMFIVVM